MIGVMIVIESEILLPVFILAMCLSWSMLTKVCSCSVPYGRWQLLEASSYLRLSWLLGLGV